MTFQSLDFVYMPSSDVAADMAYFTDVLGGRLIFAVEGMGTRVAMVELTDGQPRVLLAGHLEGDQPVLVYRVADLEQAMHELAARGWQREPTFEIPHGPVCPFRTPGGHRLAIYQLVRPEVGEHFEGRRDF
jgi:glyoxalase/bleomycin resistance protein/dioxygenase superfamily protein